MGENSLCSLFRYLYHLSCMMELLVGSENLVSFSFGFHRNLTNNEMTEVASLLSLLEGCNFREGRRDFRVWNPNPSLGYTCKFLFSLLLDPSPLRSRFFTWSGGLRFLRKLSSLSGKSCSVGLILLIGLSGGALLVMPFCSFFVGRWRKILIIFFGINILRWLCGALSFRSLVLILLAFRVSE